jgi:hypothetical protein
VNGARHREIVDLGSQDGPELNFKDPVFDGLGPFRAFEGIDHLPAIVLQLALVREMGWRVNRFHGVPRGAGGVFA